MVGFQKTQVEPTVGVKFISAGLAACYADLVTFPLDVAKVRLQIQGEGTAPVTGSKASSTLAKKVAKAANDVKPKYKGMLGTIVTMTREEGPRALYSGIVPGLQRQMCFASVRIGLYDTVKQKYLSVLGGNKGDSTSVGIRILAGITTGCLAVTCAQPTDVVKVRMQAQMSGPKRYKGSFDAYKTIARKEGVKGLWKGTGPNVARNSIVNASELVTYDLIKEKLLKLGMNDAMPCHFVSAFGAGFCTTCVGSPVDVVKTRFMNSGPGVYKGALDCAARMFREGGVKAFYKGFMPSFIRLASWNIVMFVTYEQLKLAIQHVATQGSNLPRQIPLDLETTPIVKPKPVPVGERHFPCTHETVSISLEAPSAALVWRV